MITGALADKLKVCVSNKHCDCRRVSGLVLHHHRVRIQKCQSQVMAGRLRTSFLTNTSNQKPTLGNAAGLLLIALILRSASVTGHALPAGHHRHLHEGTQPLTKLREAGAQAAKSLKDLAQPTNITKKIIMTMTDVVGNISRLTAVHIAAEMAKGLGAIIAATAAGRKADTLTGMAGKQVAAGISALLDNMSFLKLTDTDDMLRVIIAEVGAGKRA